MPRTIKQDMFFLYDAQKSGRSKNKMLLGINNDYEGGTDNISLQDLINFLQEKNIDSSMVQLPNGFTTYVKVE